MRKISFYLITIILVFTFITITVILINSRNKTKKFNNLIENKINKSNNFLQLKFNNINFKIDIKAISLFLETNPVFTYRDVKIPAKQFKSLYRFSIFDYSTTSNKKRFTLNLSSLDIMKLKKYFKHS